MSFKSGRKGVRATQRYLLPLFRSTVELTGYTIYYTSAPFSVFSLFSFFFIILSMSELLIGTSGYDYPEWKGLFYPETTKRSGFLSYYSTQFNSLELNGTYYKMPTPVQMQNMLTRSGGKVKFTVKAFQGLTHGTDRSQFQSLLAEFKKSLEPLQKASLLLCALFQFPKSFHYEKDERLYLDLLLIDELF
jgi:hypothetical protein